MRSTCPDVVDVRAKQDENVLGELASECTSRKSCSHLMKTCKPATGGRYVVAPGF